MKSKALAILTPPEGFQNDLKVYDTIDPKSLIAVIDWYQMHQSVEEITENDLVDMSKSTGLSGAQLGSISSAVTYAQRLIKRFDDDPKHFI